MMAGIDYISCDECGRRLIYDGDLVVRERMYHLDTKILICGHCVSKLKKKIEKLKKHDRRKH